MPRKKKEQVPDKSDSDSYNNSAEEQKKIAKFIDDIIKQNLKVENQKEKERLSDVGNLVSTTSEWLDSFFIIGYNMDGEELIITKAKNAKDYNSLLTLLKKAFINIVAKNEIE